MPKKSNRDILKTAHPSKRWSNKVDQMSDKQVADILKRLQDQKKL